MSDYYSNYIEVGNLNKMMSGGIIKVLKGMFPRYAVSDIVVSDNRLQFASAEFTKFAKQWQFEHVTSHQYP